MFIKRTFLSLVIATVVIDPIWGSTLRNNNNNNNRDLKKKKDEAPGQSDDCKVFKKNLKGWCTAIHAQDCTGGEDDTPSCKELVKKFLDESGEPWLPWVDPVCPCWDEEEVSSIVDDYYCTLLTETPFGGEWYFFRGTDPEQKVFSVNPTAVDQTDSSRLQPVCATFLGQVNDAMDIASEEAAICKDQLDAKCPQGYDSCPCWDEEEVSSIDGDTFIECDSDANQDSEFVEISGDVDGTEKRFRAAFDSSPFGYFCETEIGSEVLINQEQFETCKNQIVTKCDELDQPSCPCWDEEEVSSIVVGDTVACAFSSPDRNLVIITVFETDFVEFTAFFDPASDSFECSTTVPSGSVEINIDQEEYNACKTQIVDKCNEV